MILYRLKRIESWISGASYEPAAAPITSLLDVLQKCLETSGRGIRPVDETFRDARIPLRAPSLVFEFRRSPGCVRVRMRACVRMLSFPHATPRGLETSWSQAVLAIWISVTQAFSEALVEPLLRVPEKSRMLSRIRRCYHIRRRPNVGSLRRKGSLSEPSLQKTQGHGVSTENSSNPLLFTRRAVGFHFRRSPGRVCVCYYIRLKRNVVLTNTKGISLQMATKKNTQA